MRDVDDLLEREALTVEPPADGLERLLRRVRRRRRNRRVAAGAVALGVAALGFALALRAFVLPGATTAPAATTEAGNYRFEVLGVAPAPPELPNQAVVTSRLDWTTDTFPGVHRCTWTVYGQDGSAMGQLTNDVLALESGHETTQDVPASVPVDSADVTCDPERLDIGNPYEYAFSDLNVDPASTLSNVVITFQAEWLGQGRPGVMDCTVQVLDSPDHVALSARVAYAGPLGPAPSEIHAGSMPTALPPGGSHALDDAAGLTPQLECVPYTHPIPGPPAPSPEASMGASNGPSVAVLNATDQPGLAEATAADLKRAGWVVTQVGDVLGDHTAVYYASAASRPEADKLATEFFHGAPVEFLPGSIKQYANRAGLVVVLGPGYRP